MKPAAGVSGEVAAILGHPHHTTAVHAEGPFVRAGDEDVVVRAIQLHAAKCLSDIHRHNGLRRVRAHRFNKGRPLDAVSVVKADERNLHKARAFVEQLG